MAVGMLTALADACIGLADDYTWIKLHIADPGAAATTSPAGNTTRMQATWGAAGAGSTGFRQFSNTAAITWTGVSTAEDYTHFSAWNASSAGSCGFTGTITANAVQVGDTFTIPIGGLVVTYPIAT